MHSKTLRDLVKQSVEIEPLQRPSTLDLQKQIAAGYTIAMPAAQDKGTLSAPFAADLDVPMEDIGWPAPPSLLLVPEKESVPATGAGKQIGVTRDPTTPE